MTVEKQFKRLRDSKNWQPLYESERAVAVRKNPLRRSRTIVPIAAVLCLAIGGLTVWAISGDNSTAGSNETHRTSDKHHPALIAWKPIRAHAGAIRLTSLDAAPPNCASSALEVTINGGGGAGGTFWVPVTVHNTSSAACTLRDSSLDVTWAPGSKLNRTGGATRALLAGGSQTYLMGFSGSCMKVPSGSITYRPVAAALSDVPIATRGSGVPTFLSSCSDAIFTPKETTDPEDAGTGPYSMLRARIDLPSDLRAGGTVTYTLAVTNTGEDAFKFAACPTYTEGVNVEGQVATASYTLNCGGVSIQPGATISFDMQIDLPAGTGTAKFAWLMENGPSAVTAASLS